MFHLIMLILFIACAFALVWYGLQALPLPAPIKVLVQVVLGLIALIILYQATSGLNLG
mgnify:CR=1 FL=1